MPPDPTDAELDEWERYITSGWPLGPIVLRLIKALRACRQILDKRTIALNRLLSIVEDDDRDMTGEAKLRGLKRRSEAKDAVIKQALDSRAPGGLGDSCLTAPGWRKRAKAALDNLPSVAKQGEPG